MEHVSLTFRNIVHHKRIRLEKAFQYNEIFIIYHLLLFRQSQFIWNKVSDLQTLWETNSATRVQYLNTVLFIFNLKIPSQNLALRAVLCKISQFSSVQSLSRVQLFATPWIAARQASLSITSSRSLLRLMPMESVMPSSHLILCRTLLLLPPASGVFSSESTLCMRWPKYWSFSFSISPSNEHPGLISVRMDWLDLLAVQGTLKSLLQHHSSKASIFQCSAFFTVQLSHPYVTTGKTIALTRRTFVGKVGFAMLSLPCWLCHAIFAKLALPCYLCHVGFLTCYLGWS